MNRVSSDEPRGSLPRARWLVGPLLGLVSACSLLTDLHGLSGGGDARDGGSSDGGDGERDGSTSSTEAGPPGSELRLVQTTTSTFSSATAPIALSATAEDDLLIVASAHNGQSTDTLTGIVDNAPGGSSIYAFTSQRSTSDCSKSTELWAATNVKAGATSVTISTTGGGTFYVWVAEFAGLGRPTRVSGGAAISNQPANPLVTSPTVVTTSPSVVVSVGVTCSSMTGIHTGNPFIALPPLQRGSAAYFLAPSPGTFGAVWDAASSNSGWNAATAAFSAGS